MGGHKLYQVILVVFLSAGRLLTTAHAQLEEAGLPALSPTWPFMTTFPQNHVRNRVSSVIVGKSFLQDVVFAL